MRKIYSAIIIIILILLNITSYVFADDVSDIIDELFSKNQRQTEYSEIYTPLKSLFYELTAQGLPINSLLDKLKEGFSKNISPERLLAGIRHESNRIKQAFTLINKTKFTYVDDTEKRTLYKNISLFLLGGLNEALVEQILLGAKLKQDAVKVVQSLGTTILKLNTVTALSEDQLITLADVVLKSALNYTNYPMITSLFVKAKFRRISDEEMFSLVVNILKRGGGILQIEEELRRRTKR